MECRRLYTLIALFRAKPGRNGVQSARGRSPGSADHSTSVIRGIRVHPSYICESPFSLRCYQRHDTEVSTETERRPLPRSPEHLLPDIRSRKRCGRHEEDRRTDMGDVLVERIRRAQPGLQRLKMRRVVLVGNEQQPRRILRPPLFSWAASRICAVSGMTNSPSGSFFAKSGVSNSCVPVSGAPDILWRPSTLFWLLTRLVSQFSIRIWILRTT